MLTKKVILHVPHSSTKIPLTEGFIISSKELEREIIKLTDWYTNDLFYSEVDDMIIADFSRIFCDTERFTDDSTEIMAQYGMGVLYEKSDDDEIIRKVNQELRDKILRDFYWPHHNKLNELVNNQLKHFGKALIIDCHSFPDKALNRDLDKKPIRPDFNIGTDSFHTPNNLIDISKAFFKNAGYTLGIDWPYKGSIVPLEHYIKNKNVQTIMLEINRKLYLNELTNEKTNNYEEIKKITKKFILQMKNSL